MKVKLKNGAVLISDGMFAYIQLDENKKVQLDNSLFLSMQNGYIDADEAFFFQRQLEMIKAKSYDVVYPQLKARMLFPVSNEGGPGITSITYRTYDQTALAKIISAYADDLPRADVNGKETTIPVRSLGISYGYNLDEIQASQLTGAGLDTRRASAARRGTEEKINQIAFFGDSESGMPGFFDNPNIPVAAVVNPGGGTQWVNKTADQILTDMNDITNDVWTNTFMAEQASAILLPPSQWALISTTPRSANSDTTVLEYFVKNSPFISSTEQVIPVNECAAANNPTLATDAMVAYDRNPDKLQLEIPVELEYLPVQQRNLEFVIPGRSRVAGVNIYYPLSANIGTGI